LSHFCDSGLAAAALTSLLQVQRAAPTGQWRRDPRSPIALHHLMQPAGTWTAALPHHVLHLLRKPQCLWTTVIQQALRILQPTSVVLLATKPPMDNLWAKEPQVICVVFSFSLFFSFFLSTFFLSSHFHSIHLFVFVLIQLFTHSLIYSFILLFMYFFILAFIHIFIHAFIFY
jgi:hypothetical protein